MERLQGLINPCFLDEHLAAECLQHGLLTTDSLRFEEEEEEAELQFSAADLEGKMPFLQMLQCAEPPPFFPFKDPNFLSLLKTHHQTLEPESCVTHEATEQEQPMNFGSTSSSAPSTDPEMNREDAPLLKPSYGTIKERRKRKRTKAPKNKEDVENQRMTHIAVERNRRRQMNEHLNSLRSLMPPSYVQRGDQASIIGGAIDFIKELEQLLQSLETNKKIKTGNDREETKNTISPSVCDSSLSSISSNGFFMKSEEERIRAESGSEAAEIGATVIQNHVNLKVRCRRRQGLLLRAIVSLEELRLTVLHLNVTSSQDSVLYSLNLKMEDDCKLGSADEIARTVHQIITYISGG